MCGVATVMGCPSQAVVRAYHPTRMNGSSDDLRPGSGAIS